MLRRPFETLFGRFPGSFFDVFDDVPAMPVAVRTRYHPRDFEVFDEEAKFVVRGDTSGVPSDKIEISFNEKKGMMTVKGSYEGRSEDKDKDGKVLGSQTQSVMFERHFELPEKIKKDEISATVENDELVIVVPKVVDEKKEGKKLKIKMLED